MDTVDRNLARNDNNSRMTPSPASKPLNRLAAARESKGVTAHALAQRLNTTESYVLQQEQTAADLPLSALYQWADALRLPIAELLADRGDLAVPRFNYTQSVELLRTTRRILRQAEHPRIRRLAEMLHAQLLELVPDVREARRSTSGQSSGAKKEQRLVLRPLSQQVFIKSAEDR